MPIRSGGVLSNRRNRKRITTAKPSEFELHGDMRILSSQISQSHNYEYLPACLTHSLVAACFEKEPTDWSRHDLTRILNAGYTNYKTIMSPDEEMKRTGQGRYLDAFDAGKLDYKASFTALIFFVYLFSCLF